MHRKYEECFHKKRLIACFEALIVITNYQEKFSDIFNVHKET